MLWLSGSPQIICRSINVRFMALLAAIAPDLQLQPSPASCVAEKAGLPAHRQNKYADKCVHTRAKPTLTSIFHGSPRCKPLEPDPPDPRPAMSVFKITTASSSRWWLWCWAGECSEAEDPRQRRPDPQIQSSDRRSRYAFLEILWTKLKTLGESPISSKISNVFHKISKNNSKPLFTKKSVYNFMNFDSLVCLIP